MKKLDEVFDMCPNFYDRESFANGYIKGYHQAEKDFATAYIVTRCEEHSDYVEEVFFDENKAQKYCDQFKGNENEYARHITKVKITL